jgi:hypothetical protein
MRDEVEVFFGKRGGCSRDQLFSSWTIQLIRSTDLDSILFDRVSLSYRDGSVSRNFQWSILIPFLSIFSVLFRISASVVLVDQTVVR